MIELRRARMTSRQRASPFGRTRTPLLGDGKFAWRCEFPTGGGNVVERVIRTAHYPLATAKARVLTARVTVTRVASTGDSLYRCGADAHHVANSFRRRVAHTRLFDHLLSEAATTGE